MRLTLENFKHSCLIALFVLSVPLAGTAGASSHSGSGSHATSSHSFKGGFSSQRSQPAAAPAPAPSRSSFGSFGKQSASAAPAMAPSKSNSALNRDLEKNQAQANALKSMDARQQAAAPAQHTSVTGQPLPPPAAPAMPVQQPPVVVVQRESSSFGGAFWGYMLGSAMSRPHNTVVYTDGRSAAPQANGDASNNGSNNGSYSGGVVAGPAAGAVAATPAPAPSEGFGWKLLRLLLWGLILGALAWLAWRIYRAVQPGKAADNTTHYSLGKM